MAAYAFTPLRQLTQDLTIIRMQSQVMLRLCQSGAVSDPDQLRHRVAEVEKATARIKAMLGDGSPAPMVAPADVSLAVES